MAKLSIKFEPRDAWVGLFWDRKPTGLQLVVCPVPFVAITLLIPPKREPYMCHECGRDAYAGNLCDDCHDFFGT